MDVVVDADVLADADGSCGAGVVSVSVSVSVSGNVDDYDNAYVYAIGG